MLKHLKVLFNFLVWGRKSVLFFTKIASYGGIFSYYVAANIHKDSLKWWNVFLLCGSK